MDKIKNEEIVFREVNDLILNCNEREIRAKIDQSPELQEYLTSNELWDGESIHFWKCNWSPLHTAARYGRESVVRTLVEEFRIKVDAKQSYRTWSGTALHAAIYWNRPWIVKILIGYGADTSLNGRHWNGKVFKDAQHYSEILGDRNEIIRILQNINKGSGKMLRDLILANKDVEIQELLDSNKELQNYVAAQKTWLWSSFSMWYTNWSPLHLAVSLDQPSVIKLLVRDYGACVNAVHVYGKGSTTPLHRAIELNNIDMAKLLLILGADATLSGSGIDGRRFDSAMNYAQKLQGREEICQALSEQQVV